MSLLARLDRLLARWSMYRLVAGLLGALAALAILFAATGALEPVIFPAGWMLASLVVLVAVVAATDACAGWMLRRPVHRESALITALLLWFLYWPARDLGGLAWLALPAALAIVSKHLVTWRGRHLVNPAVAGVLLTVVVQELAGISAPDRLWTTWWVAAEPLALPVLVAALLVVRRTALLIPALLFVVVALVVVIAGLVDQGLALGDALRTAATSWPLVFLAGFMLTEPLTLAPRRAVRLGSAVLAALVVSLPMLTGLLGVDPIEPWIFGSWTELGIVVANLVAFVAAPAYARTLELVGSRRVAQDIHEFTFRGAVPVGFRPGQYVELDLPHPRPDARGRRRWLSLTSAPGGGGGSRAAGGGGGSRRAGSDDGAGGGTAEIRVATRIGEDPSSFKRALLAARPGERARLAWVGGDFVLAADPEPVVLVAGGIGVTPFLSQLAAEPGRDAVLVWAITGPEIPFREELLAAGLPVVIIAPIPVELGPGWRQLEADTLTADLVAAAVPDLADRAAYVSGRPTMVEALRRGLRGRARRVRTDVFTGL